MSLCTNVLCLDYFFGLLSAIRFFDGRTGNAIGKVFTHESEIVKIALSQVRGDLLAVSSCAFRIPRV